MALTYPESQNKYPISSFSINPKPHVSDRLLPPPSRAQEAH